MRTPPPIPKVGPVRVVLTSSLNDVFSEGLRPRKRSAAFHSEEFSLTNQEFTRSFKNTRKDVKSS